MFQSSPTPAWLRPVSHRPGAALALLVFACCSAALHARPLVPAPDAAVNQWTRHLSDELVALDARSAAEIGVHVRDLGDDTSVGYQTGKPWYIASMVKLPVAIAVLRGVEAGSFTLETTLRLRASDYVDGAGMTNSQSLATPLSIRYLLEQMIIHSDNTASDMLIGLVGAAEVNAVVAGLVPQGFGRITTLAEVRRLVYGQLTPAARHLTGADLIELQRQPSDRDRLARLSQIVQVPVGDFKRKSLDAAYNAYYATGLNSARLDAYGQLLALVVQGKALAPESTGYLLGLMARTETGAGRIKAGLAPGMRFAHKTGTQRRLVCDAGLVEVAQPGQVKRAIVVACARGERSLPLAESALRDIGNAICRSGLLTEGITDASSCLAPRAERLPASAAADHSAGPGR